MARKGDGLYQRGKVWYLDFRHEGRRHVCRLGKGISRSVAREIATMKRTQVLRGEAGIRKKRDISFKDAREKFEVWASANKKPNTVTNYKECLRRLAESFGGKRLSEISPFAVEAHKQRRIQAGAPVRANHEVAALKAVFHRCLDWGVFEGSNPVCKVRLVSTAFTMLRPSRSPKKPVWRWARSTITSRA